MWDRVLFNRGGLGGIVGVAAAILALGAGPGLLLAMGQFVLYVLDLAPSVDGLGLPLARSAVSAASPTNLRIHAWLTGGEIHPSDRHADPASQKFSMRRLQFNPSCAVTPALM